MRVGATNIGQEAITCVKTVRAFATEDTETDRYTEKLQETHRLGRNDDVVGPSMASLNQVWRQSLFSSKGV